ncbi:MAG: class I SAM-dependent methyltransferase [Planctomycetota bacterium]|nr:class I SAM-dependent methyltransferase [Planctomycetota bacterium]
MDQKVAGERDLAASSYKEFGYESVGGFHTHGYLLPAILSVCPTLGSGVRVLDVGCGNGAMAGEFLARGCNVVGIDLSEQGIEIARKTHPTARFEVLAADEHVLENLAENPFDLVISTEVVEHLYDPRSYARGCFVATKPGGRFICSTPFHGYLKNLILSLAGKWDSHANPLWDGGHIKLWSRNTLSQLLAEAGFGNLKFKGTGRLPLLWMSMLVYGDRVAHPA